MTNFPQVNALEDSAGLSECDAYRWWLTRSTSVSRSLFSPARPPLVVCMLNPSTADASTNDQTIRKLIAFARAGDRGGLIVVNAYAFRAREPRDLLRAADPVGGLNDHVHKAIACSIWREWRDTCPIVVAWGRLCTPARAAAVAAIWRGCRIPILSWGRNVDGSPPHPLYLPLSTPLEPWCLPNDLITTDGE